jgi:type IV secretion system protein VirB2
VNYRNAGKFALKLTLASAVGIALMPASAYAQSAAPIEGVLEWFVGVLQGSIARSFAIIAVCFLGFMAMTGRLAWMMAFSIIIGIALIFGAAQLVDSVRATAGGA